ncbi:MAG: radical SAM family heme chaperone HemW [Clostridia bacterium]|nr:radical SAM family heme chaperone HemW [Clostridia bacterium]
MKYLPDSIGLYIHIPFCNKKCLYCDFYSACFNKKVYEDFLSALFREIKAWGKKINRSVDTVYFGGGTPSILGEDIIPLMSVIKESFNVSESAEITAECNPNNCLEFLPSAKESGVNRLSFGVQAGDNSRLKALGRTHTAEDCKQAVNLARQLGFDNISVDIMIALPDSNRVTLKEDIDFILSLNPEHISAYMLKIEENTAFYIRQSSLNLPDEDQAAKQYLTLCSELEAIGYEHYEISSFAKRNLKSRHNLKYWRDLEYLGIGPSAHSFISGKRFYYPRDIKAFIKGNDPVSDGTGGGKTERIMLGLRTNDGVPTSLLSDVQLKRTPAFEKAGLLNIKDSKIYLTDRGMLLSNSIITELLYEDI